jgi:hypothetical protein
MGEELRGSRVWMLRTLSGDGVIVEDCKSIAHGRVQIVPEIASAEKMQMCMRCLEGDIVEVVSRRKERRASTSSRT